MTDCLCRHGGGTGSEDIRKIAYFEQSIDPEILKVNMIIQQFKRILISLSTVLNHIIFFFLLK